MSMGFVLRIRSVLNTACRAICLCLRQYHGAAQRHPASHTWNGFQPQPDRTRTKPLNGHDRLKLMLPAVEQLDHQELPFGVSGAVRSVLCPVLLRQERMPLLVRPRHLGQFVGTTACVDGEEQRFVGVGGCTQPDLRHGHRAAESSTTSTSEGRLAHAGSSAAGRLVAPAHMPCCRPNR